ncbi:MAG: site-specific DNA-methyltransferase [Planctomycetes bacterium]|nr:site-specific DNA-methyltransferase [Planctomycetota bacterium]
MTNHDDAPERFDLRSLDIAAEKRAELLRLFPECATEGGMVDFERLKAALGKQVDVGKERYGLTWPGKAACFQTIQRPSLATLRPKVEESVEFDTTQNVIIEGDNLEVLKLLQKSYLGKVKMIYIDPPYNTGNDFIYPDNYTESLQTYLDYTGQVDAEGRKFSTNTEADGRFHSKWLNMMYPRLYLARNLLREDGVIFISIDDTEHANLRHLLNDVFGEECFVANFVWQKRYSRDNRPTVGAVHDHVVLVARNVEAFARVRNLLPPDDSSTKVYRNPNNDPRGRWRPIPMTAQGTRPNQMYKVVAPGGRVHEPPPGRCWGMLEADYLKLRDAGLIWFGNDKNGQPNVIRYLSEVEGFVPWTWWPHTECGHNDEAKKELFGYFAKDSAFDTPKPTRLMRRMLHLATSPGAGDLVLDFFAGSGTVGDAVLAQNLEDGGNRRFILVQLPEPIAKSEDGIRTIADITKERVRRVIKNLNDADKGQLRSANDPKPDRGFRVFQLAASNFKPWDGDRSKDAKALNEQLELQLEHVLPDRSEQDLLYEILLKDGFELTTPIETTTVHGFRVHSVAGGELLLCLQDKLTHELITTLADKKPSRVVFLDRGFRDNDQLKANAAKLFASKAGDNFKKFKTV